MGELTMEQKKSLIEQRLSEYKTKLFSLEMDKTALLAVGDTQGVESIDQRIEAIRKAHNAVQGMI